MGGDSDQGQGSARWADPIRQLAAKFEQRNILSFGDGNQDLVRELGWDLRSANPLVASDAVTPADLVICTNFLEYVAEPQMSAVLDALERAVTRVGFLVVCAPGDRRPMSWWYPQLRKHFTIMHSQEFAGDAFVILVNPHRLPRHLRTGSAAAIRVFIGSEPRQWIAEAVLHYSIEASASLPVDVVSMDYSRGGTWAGWDMGRAPQRPATAGVNDRGFHVWGTEFTNFRWAIPEVCEFKGRAIYLDSDILVLDDLRKLWELPMPAPILALHDRETSVMLMDCEAIGALENWPSLESMKTNGFDIMEYLDLLADADAIGQLPPVWNCLDGRSFQQGKTQLIHYTDMGTQPWRPYPDRIHYRTHPVPAVEELWFEYAARARKTGWLESPPTALRADESR